MISKEHARSVGRSIERRVVNPIVVWILRSPVHWVVSKWLTVLTYEGRHSGRSFTTPVLYRRDDDHIVLLTPAEETTWWKNFREAHPLTVLVRGTRLAGTGTVEADDDAVLETVYWAVSPMRLATDLLLGRTIPSENQLRDAADDFVVVFVMVDDDRRTAGEAGVSR